MDKRSINTSARMLSVVIVKLPILFSTAASSQIISTSNTLTRRVNRPLVGRIGIVAVIPRGQPPPGTKPTTPATVIVYMIEYPAKDDSGTLLHLIHPRLGNFYITGIFLGKDGDKTVIPIHKQEPVAKPGVVPRVPG